MKAILNKIILEINENNVITYKKYESVLKISKDPLYNFASYDNWRALYLGHKKQLKTGNPVKYRDGNLILSKKYKVYDNVEYLNRFIQTDGVQPVIAP